MDSYIALIASAWETRELELVLPMLSKTPDRAREILAYQEAGWPPARIVRLMREGESWPDAPGLSLPPPEPEVEAEMPAGIVPLGEVDQLLSGKRGADPDSECDVATVA